jgi:hypothetical protein
MNIVRDKFGRFGKGTISDYQFKKGNKGHWLGKKRSEEMKEKIRNKLKGFKHSEQAKKNMSEAAKRNGTGKWMTGRKLSEETKKKLNLFKKGNKYAWRGGKSFESYSTDWTKTLRISIRERDKYICKVCGEKQGDIMHHVHHIDYEKKNCNPSNLITLCKSCHSKTVGNRKYWIEYFKLITN